MTEQAPIHLYSPQETEAMLALAATGELGADPMQPAIDLSRLSANEIFNAVHHVLDARSRMPDLAEDAHPSQLDERLSQYEPDLDTAFDRLQDYLDPRKIREVYGLLVDSGSPPDRRFAGAYVRTLTRIDRAYGLELWERLLNDEDQEVGASTWELSTGRYLECAPEELRTELASDGLTWEDFQGLVWDYIYKLELFRKGNTYPDGYVS